MSGARVDMMKLPLRVWVILGAMALALSGCATGSKFTGPISLSPSPDLKLRWANAKRKQDGLLVYGQVQSPRGYPGKLSGHLHFVALGSTGEVVAFTDARWGDFMAREFFSAYFKAKLPIADSTEVARIRIEIQPDNGRLTGK